MKRVVSLTIAIIAVTGLTAQHIDTAGWARSENIQLYFRSLGVGDPVIIVHGGPGFDHLHLLEGFRFISDNRQVIFYDQRGTGLSTPRVDSISITMENFVMDLENIRKSLGINRFVVLGHSFGGLLALNYAIKYPKNLNGLILIDTAPGSSDFYTELRSNINERRNQEDSLRLVEIAQSPDFRSRNPKVMEDFFIRWFNPYYYDQVNAPKSLEMSPNTAFNAMAVNNLMSKSYLSNYNILDKLNVIEAPTLVIHGDSDPIPMIAVEKIVEALPNSELQVLKKSGHMPYVEARKAMTDTIKGFLDRISPR